VWLDVCVGLLAVWWWWWWCVCVCVCVAWRAVPCMWACTYAKGVLTSPSSTSFGTATKMAARTPADATANSKTNGPARRTEPYWAIARRSLMVLDASALALNAVEYLDRTG